jgi:putative CocE/NonD family hydrolase
MTALARTVVLLALVATVACGSVPAGDTAWWAASDPTRAPAPERFAAVDRTSIYVPMRDGVRLAIDVYLPAGRAPGELFPAILVQTRYNRGLEARWPFGRLARDRFHDTIQTFVRQGYAWVYADVRGSGASFGTQPYPYAADEVQDGVELVDWIVRQPWSDGQVGAWGSSYTGGSALRLASRGHPALKAVMARFSMFDGFTEVVFPGGLHLRWLTETWGTLARALDSNRVADFVGWKARLAVRGVRPVDADPERKELALAVAEHATNGDLRALPRGITFRDDPSGVLPGVQADAISPGVGAPAVRASGVHVYLVSGWLDASFVRSAAHWFWNLDPARTRLTIGPWDHGGFTMISPWGPGARVRFDGDGEALRFFDTVLKGADRGLATEPRVHYYTQGEERWGSAEDWPPPGLEERAVYLAPGRALAWKPSGEESHDTYQVDPTTSTGDHTRWESLVNLDRERIGYFDRAEADRKLLVYDSAPLDAPLTITGHPIVVFHVGTSTPDGDLFVYLEAVDERGRVHYLTEGMFRLIHRRLPDTPPTWRTRLPWHSFLRADAAPLSPDEIAEVTFDLYPTSLRPGVPEPGRAAGRAGRGGRGVRGRGAAGQAVLRRLWRRGDHQRRRADGPGPVRVGVARGLPGARRPHGPRDVRVVPLRSGRAPRGARRPVPVRSQAFRRREPPASHGGLERRYPGAVSRSAGRSRRGSRHSADPGGPGDQRRRAIHRGPGRFSVGERVQRRGTVVASPRLRKGQVPSAAAKRELHRSWRAATPGSHANRRADRVSGVDACLGWVRGGRVKALVIGADGLLGSHLVRRLLDRGLEVRALIQPGSRSETLEGLPLQRMEGDLLDGTERLADAMAGCQGVFHLAAITSMWAPRELTFKVNVGGTRRVLEACLKAGVTRLIFCGSASSYQFGTLEAPGDEDGPFPEAYRGVAYMESKYEALQLVKGYVRDRGLDAVIVAPTFMLGDLDARPSSGELVRQFIRREMSVTTRGGRNFAYAPDVATAVVNAIEKGRRGESYLLGGVNLTYRDFFSRVAEQAGLEPPTHTLPEAAVLAAGAVGSLASKLTGKAAALNYTLARLSACGTYYSSEKAIRELDLPQTPIEAAIADTIKSLLRYGHLREPGDAAFHGKVVMVTGASRGVGFATARALVRKGAKVVITARGEARLLDSKRKLEAIGGQVEAVTGDVGDRADAERMVGVALSRFGRLDILVNNAGVSMRGSFADLAPEVIETIVKTNLMGSLLPTRAAVEQIVANRGSVVFISSIAGLFGLPGASPYCATKGALTQLAESLRTELGAMDVHVGVVYLGYTEHDPEKRILAADGSPVKPGRPAHHSQNHAASLILKMIARREKRLVMTAAGKAGSAVHQLFPGLLEDLIVTAQRREWKIYKRFSG